MLNISDKTFVTDFIAYFRAKGLNDNGIAGLLGNIYAESGCRTNNLQNSCNTKFGMSDEEFTSAVDEGRFDFCDPNVKFGYGMCQWTSIGRRTGLFNHLKSRGLSIADRQGQFSWLYEELSVKYKTVLAELVREGNSVRSCAEIVVCKFEVPASVIQGGTAKENTIVKRTEYAQDFLLYYIDPIAYPTETEKEPEMAKKILAISAGHCLTTAGKRCNKALDPNETREWVLNARVATALESILSGYEGIETVRLDDPTGKTAIMIEDRKKMSDKIKADLYLAIHHNAGINLGAGGGVVVYHYPLEKDRVKAQKLYNCIIRHNGLKGNRSTPVKATTTLYEVSAPLADSLLIENGFMDSTHDTPLIIQESFSRKTAEGIAEFIIDLWELKKKDGSVAQPTVPQPVVEAPATYTVVKGDTLSKIAKANGTTYQNLAKINGIKSPYTIYVGQVIKLK